MFTTLAFANCCLRDAATGVAALPLAVFDICMPAAVGRPSRDVTRKRKDAANARKEMTSAEKI